MQFSAVAITGSENLKMKILHFNKIKCPDTVNGLKYFKYPGYL